MMELYPLGIRGVINQSPVYKGNSNTRVTPSSLQSMQEEVATALQAMANKKATGPNGLPLDWL